MKRISSQPRPDWQQRVEDLGLVYHTADDRQPYWNESAYYLFDEREIEELEKATYALNDMCLEAVEHVVSGRHFDPFRIPEQFRQWITTSWETEEHTMYGRFDLAYDGQGPPKLYEYNADTPTALLEAAVIQWYWLQETLQPTGSFDQFNSIHERLVEAWQAWPQNAAGEGPMYFLSLDDPLEDVITTNYLLDTASQAGLPVQQLPLGELGWDSARMDFVTPGGDRVRQAFKLYPWEWILREPFAEHLLLNTCRWLEAPWKILLSSKAILPVLWELFPDSPYLLKASHQPMSDDHVRKPIYGREGANVSVFKHGRVQAETGGPYAGEGFIYQQHRPPPVFDQQHVIVGSWMINGHAAGIGIREDRSPVTGNLASFCPHAYAPA